MRTVSSEETAQDVRKPFSPLISEDILGLALREGPQMSEDENPLYWKSKFLYRYRPEGVFQIFFGLILDPPPVHMLLQRKKADSFVPAIFFPHCMAFLEKRGGLVPVYVFIFPALID